MTQSVQPKSLNNVWIFVTLFHKHEEEIRGISKLRGREEKDNMRKVREREQREKQDAS